ncbi:hypothetical protein M885DRAFT_525400 [Pelagophyceae sp. CCMP2097]|nr:hypothetical protein M885DRAFT_525400 [Pelagophyceae sp. CCMP2097]
MASAEAVRGAPEKSDEELLADHLGAAGVRSRNGLVDACVDAAFQFFDARNDRYPKVRKVLAEHRSARSTAQAAPTVQTRRQLQELAAAELQLAAAELRLAMRRAISGLPESSEFLPEDAQKVLRALRRRGRVALTGDEDMRIRDHLRLRGNAMNLRLRTSTTNMRTKVEGELKKPPVVKTVDKVLFTGGVLWLVATEHVLLCHRPQMAWWYACSMGPMLVHRLYTYSKCRQVYFCYDFCYFVNVLAFYIIATLPRSDILHSRLFNVCFCLANGPLIAAIFVWRNSFVFHDLDRVCSTMLHALPPLWSYTVRWGDPRSTTVETDLKALQVSLGKLLAAPGECSSFECLSVEFQSLNSLASAATAAEARLRSASSVVAVPMLSFYDVFGRPLFVYLVWQALYILKTEWWDRHSIKSKDESTSLRWLVRDTKGGMYRLCKQVAVQVGTMHQDEGFGEDEWKTKLTFWTAQLVYTLVTLFPVALMWSSQACHATYIAALYASAVYNGASYYVEVFSTRYMKKFDHIVEEAPPALHADDDDDLDQYLSLDEEGDDDDAQAEAAPAAAPAEDAPADAAPADGAAPDDAAAAAAAPHTAEPRPPAEDESSP